MDTLTIQALTVATQIGVHAWEQKIKQNLVMDISIPTDLSQCNEDLTKTINYDTLCSSVTEFVASKPFRLIETVANEVASLILKQFAVREVKVRVAKPHAVSNAGLIQVEVSRKA